MAGVAVRSGKPKTGDWRHIVERGGRLYLRLRIPQDVRGHFGQKEHIERALGTSDILTARRQRNRLLPELEAAFAEARTLPPPDVYRPVLARYGLTAPITPDRIKDLKAALRLEEDLMAEADEARIQSEMQSSREWLDSLSDAQIEALRMRALYAYRAPVLETQAQRPLAAVAPGGIVNPGEALAEIERVEGKVTASDTTTLTGARTIWTAWERYKEDRKPTGKTEHEWRRSLELFEEAMRLDVDSAPISLEEITREHVRIYARFLRSRPSGRGGLVSDDTINKRISALRSVLEVAVKNDWITKNPAAGATTKAARGTVKNQRLPLLITEIEAVQSVLKPASSDAWAWTLLRYTGARLGEIIQLHKSDVRRHPDGTWFIRITAEGEKHVKTPSSVRDVPLHHDIAWAFASWVRTKRDGPLWADCWHQVTEDGTTRTVPSAAAISKRLNRRLRAAGIDDERKTVHSLRHAMKDALRYVCRDEELRDAILGHAGVATVGRRYGDGHYLRSLADTINLIDVNEIKRIQAHNAATWQVAEDVSDTAV